MTIQAADGPLVTRYASAGQSVGIGIANINPQQGPNLWAFGDAMLDPRMPYTYFPGGSVTDRVVGFLTNEIQSLCAVPSALATNNISAAANPGANPLALVTTSGAGITVGVTITRADTMTQVTGLLAIDSANTPFSFGQDAQSSVWSPALTLARNVRITAVGDESSRTYTVNGFDVYGYPVTENITGPNATTTSGVKTFKYIQSITHTGTATSNVSAGTGDVFGFPIRCDTWGELRIFWNNAFITATTGFTAAVTTNPATATTGDIRGTYAVQSASDGTKRLHIYQTPQLANMTSVTGLFGVANFGSTNNGT